MRTLPLLALLLVGCPPWIHPGDHLAVTEAPPDEEAPDWAEPWSLSLEATFLTDRDEGLAGGYDLAGEWVDPRAEIVLYDDRGAPICTLEIVQRGALDLSDLSDPGVDPGLFFDLASADLLEDCSGHLDPEIWGEDVAATLAEDLVLGIGITGRPGPYMAAIFEDAAPDPVAWQDTHAETILGARPALLDGTVHREGEDYWYARGLRVEGGAAQDSDFFTADELLDETPNAVAWIVECPFTIGWGVPLHEILLPR